MLDPMESDEELERIREKKLKEMMERVSETDEKEKSASDKPVEITDATFKETIQNNPLVVVDCWAAWCGPCRMIAPIVDELAEEYEDKISFTKLDVDQNPKTANNYGVMTIPTLLIFRNGKPVSNMVGLRSKADLKRNLDEALE